MTMRTTKRLLLVGLLGAAAALGPSSVLAATLPVCPSGCAFSQIGPAVGATLQNSNVCGNVLTGSAGLTLQGGGLYIQNEPLTLTNSIITRNVPDQCSGC